MAQQQKTVVVTGGASGIGRATALRFADLSYDVFVADLSITSDVQAAFAAAGIRFSEVDVRQTGPLLAFIHGAVDQTGRLDVLVNNAGVGLVKPIAQVTESEWDSVLDTNLKAAFFGCQAGIEAMGKQSEGGCVINVASNAGLLPRSHDPVYSISKMALVGLTKSLALCHSKDKIRINCVCPGPVENTRMIEENFEGREDRQQVVNELISASPLARAWGRMVSTTEIADTILYLASDAARMVTGTAIAIDGGKSLRVPPAH